MPDFLAMFDGLVNVFSAAKAAGEVDELDGNNKGKKKSEEIEDDTKEKIHEIVDKRQKEIAQRREDQSHIADQHRHRHKR